MDDDHITREEPLPPLENEWEERTVDELRRMFTKTSWGSGVLVLSSLLTFIASFTITIVLLTETELTLEKTLAFIIVLVVILAVLLWAAAFSLICKKCGGWILPHDGLTYWKCLSRKCQHEEYRGSDE